MSSTSRSGLVPTPTKQSYLSTRASKSGKDRLPTHFEAIPMPLSLRTFGGLFNPFSRGCSVLCNHPAPSGVRNIIHQLKTNLAAEVRSAQLSKEKLANAVKKNSNDIDNIPEDLFRRYAATDSRPLTPSPTGASGRTRTSAGSFLNNRRCITPELSKNEEFKRKKIILDLRRSHSQETLYWKATSDLSQSIADGVGSANELKPNSDSNDETDKLSKHHKLDQDLPKSCTFLEHNDEDISGGVKKSSSRGCINEHDLSDEDVRRGKKRKKIKPQPATTTFYLSEDPETQVAALGPDSLNPSTRPSLIPNAVNLLPSKNKRETDEPVLLKDSFLTNDALQVLKTELDVDNIENTFGRYLNRALREAIKYLPPKPPKALEKANEPIMSKTILSMAKIPRKLSKSSTRFDVPLNWLLLEKMTVLEYLGKFVWVSKQRKQLYKIAFVKHVNRTEESQMLNTEDLEKVHELEQNREVDVPKSPSSQRNDSPPKSHNAPGNVEIETNIDCPQFQYVQRKICSKYVPKAIEEVLDYYGTENNVQRVLHIIDWHEDLSTTFDFRTWCGICAFAERVALDQHNDTDSADELEKSDFTSLEERLPLINLTENMAQVFRTIRLSHIISECPKRTVQNPNR